MEAIKLRKLLERYKAPLLKALKVYAVFAGAHFVFKLLRRVYFVLRARKLLKNVAGQQFSLFKFSWLGTDTMKNMHNYFDYRTKPQLEHPKAPLVATAGPFVEVMCNDRASVKHLLKDDFNTFTKPAPGQDYLLEIMKDFLGYKGIFVIQHGKGFTPQLEAAHKVWYSQRKTASKIFTKSAFSSMMLETFNLKANIMKKTLLQQQGQQVDMQRMFFRFTFDSIQKIFFGRDIDTVSGRDTDEYAQAYDLAHRNMVDIYLTYIPVHVMAQMYLPFPFGTLGVESSGWSLLMWMIRKVTKAGRDFAHYCQVLDEGTFKLIREARNDPKLAARKDLLANFLNSDQKYSDEDLRDIVLNFIIAGRDTTACTLSWLFYNLSCHPELQEQVAKEADGIIQGQEVTYEMTQSMDLLTACIYETLRLNPPVPEDSKIASADSVFPDGTVVPKGTKVTFHNYSLARNPALYDDPLTFKPSRWFDDEGKLKPLDTFYSPIFQAGQRECLGKAMALLEIRALAASLLATTPSGPGLKFDISEEEAKNVTWALMITQSISNSPDRDSHHLWLTPSPRA